MTSYCLRMCFVAVLGTVCAMALYARARGAEAQSHITVNDLVREAQLGEPNTITWAERDGAVAAYSPDQRWAVVVVRWGDPEARANRAQLLLFDMASLMSKPTPRVLADFATTTSYQPISLVQWSASSDNVIFAGTADSGPTQVYRVNIASGALTQLTHEARQILWYGITPTLSETVAIVEALPHPPEEDPQCVSQGCLVTATQMDRAEKGLSDSPNPSIAYRLSDGERRVVGDPGNVEDIEYCADDLKGGISPDGRFGVRICRLKPFRWPKWWEDYTWDRVSAERIKRGHGGILRQLMLLDFRRGTASKLTEAPIEYGNVLIAGNPVWIDGGRELVVVGACESLVGVGPQERARRAAAQSVLGIDPVSGATRRLASLPADFAEATEVHWDPAHRVLRFRGKDASGRALPFECLHERDQSWRRQEGCHAPDAGDSREPLRLVKEESLRQRPLLVAIDTATGKRKVLLDPNAWLTERKLGEVRVVRWRSKDGLEWDGGLYYPPEYQSGSRYPLVIQTHGFDPDRFSLYGYSRNFAAQAFAAQGIAVLQMSEGSASSRLGPQEWPAMQHGFEGAIDYLDSVGLIDRQRVGIIGWSRTGIHTGYMVTHSSYPIAAIALTDPGDIGWWTYLGGGVREFDTSFGVPPFGAGLEVWAKMSPSFNLDKVRAPVLMWAGRSVIFNWDWYSGLRMLGSPIEYWYLPTGAHELLAVGQRLFTSQLLVDWFRYWLKGESDPDPAKSAQYTRWQAMRGQLAARLSAEGNHAPVETVR